MHSDQGQGLETTKSGALHGEACLQNCHPVRQAEVRPFFSVLDHGTQTGPKRGHIGAANTTYGWKRTIHCRKATFTSPCGSRPWAGLLETVGHQSWSGQLPFSAILCYSFACFGPGPVWAEFGPSRPAEVRFGRKVRIPGPLRWCCRIPGHQGASGSPRISVLVACLLLLACQSPSPPTGPPIR